MLTIWLCTRQEKDHISSSSQQSLINSCSQGPDHDPFAESLSGEILGKLTPISSVADLPVQFDQKLQPAGNAFGPEKSLFSCRDLKKEDGERKWSPKSQQFRRNLAKQGKFEDEGLLPEHDQSNGSQQRLLPDSSQQTQPTVTSTKDQSQALLSRETSSLRRIRLPDPDKDVGYRTVPPSDSQDLELRYLSGVSGNFVQVQSSYASSSVLNINIHSSPTLQANSKLLGGKFSRSWAGT